MARIYLAGPHWSMGVFVHGTNMDRNASCRLFTGSKQPETALFAEWEVVLVTADVECLLGCQENQ